MDASIELKPTAMLRAMTASAEEHRGVRMTREVAEPADPWPADPRGAEVYRRLIEALLRWRAFSYLVMPGTETGGRQTL